MNTAELFSTLSLCYVMLSAHLLWNKQHESNIMA